MSPLTTQALVDFCLEKRASPAAFHALLKQVSHKQPISAEDVSALVATQTQLEPLAVAYITGSVFKEQSTGLKFSVVLSSLSQGSLENQKLLLSGIVSYLNTFQELPFSSHDLPEAIGSFLGYVQYAIPHSDTKVLELCGRFLSLLGALLPLQISLPSLTGEQSEVLSTLAEKIKVHSPSLSEELISSLEKLQKKKARTTSRHSSLSMASATGLSQHSSFIKSSKLARFVWINGAVQCWRTHKKGFLASFEQFVKVKSSQNILNELIGVSFEGYAVAQQIKDDDPKFAKNWELFLTKRLPLLVKELKLKNIESSLMNSLHLDPKVAQALKIRSSGGGIDNNDEMFSSFPSTATDIRHEFLRSCISLQLLSPSAFEAILKQDAAADSRHLQTNDSVSDESGQTVDLEATLKRTLLDINTEFVPLEESGLLEFLQLMDKMEGTKQVELSSLIHTSIKAFINNEDTSHLYRLCLALALVPDALHSLLFHLSPETFLKPIMNFLDSWQTNSDDINFQDTYSSFGCIFLVFLYIVKEFNITLAQVISIKETLNAESFCISYLTTMGISSWKNPTGELNQHRSEVLNGWMAALFDSGGISDDLMRLSTIQECFELFPVIFQQAFVACKQGLTDVDTIKGGLEYFLQPFLLSTIVGLLSWCEDYLWKCQDVELLVNLMKTLVTPSELNGESVHIHRIILSIFAPKLYKMLSDLDSNNSPLRVDSAVLSSLRQSTRTTKSLVFFELDSSPVITNITNNTNQTISLSVLFQMEFQSLVSWGQSSTLSRYDHLFLPNMFRLIGEDALINCFVEQILHSQQLNKSTLTVIELSAFLLLNDSIGYSSEHRNVFLNALKSETAPERAADSLIPGSNTLKALIARKKEIGEPTTELDSAFVLLYDKLIETAAAIYPLD